MRTETNKPKMSGLTKLAYGLAIGGSLLVGKGLVPQSTEVRDAKLLNVYDIRGSGPTSTYLIENDTISINGKPENAKKGNMYRVITKHAAFTDYHTVLNK